MLSSPLGCTWIKIEQQPIMIVDNPNYHIIALMF